MSYRHGVGFSIDVGTLLGAISSHWAKNNGEGMSLKQMRWPVLASIAVLVVFVATLLLPPVPRPKARAMQISAVNSVAPASLKLSGTNH